MGKKNITFENFLVIFIQYVKLHFFANTQCRVQVTSIYKPLFRNKRSRSRTENSESKSKQGGIAGIHQDKGQGLKLETQTPNIETPVQRQEVKGKDHTGCQFSSLLGWVRKAYNFLLAGKVLIWINKLVPGDKFEYLLYTHRENATNTHTDIQLLY